MSHIKICVAGADGRMGSTVIREAASINEFKVVGALTALESNNAGKTLGEIGLTPKEVKILTPQDLEEALKEKPEIVVIGTGEYGVAEVYPDALEFLKKKKIEFFIEPTGKAVEIFNQFKKENKKVVGLFHLTC